MWAKAFDKAAAEVQEEIFLDDNGDKEILTFVVYFPASGFKVQAPVQFSQEPAGDAGLRHHRRSRLP